MRKRETFFFLLLYNFKWLSFFVVKKLFSLLKWNYGNKKQKKNAHTHTRTLPSSDTYAQQTIRLPYKIYKHGILLFSSLNFRLTFVPFSLLFFFLSVLLQYISCLDLKIFFTKWKCEAENDDNYAKTPKMGTLIFIRFFLFIFLFLLT